MSFRRIFRREPWDGRVHRPAGHVRHPRFCTPAHGHRGGSQAHRVLRQLCLLLPSWKKQRRDDWQAYRRHLAGGDEGILFLDRVYRTGKIEPNLEQEEANPQPLYWSYEVWPILAKPTEGDHPARVTIQVSETTPFDSRVTAMNEALLISAVRQHELMEAAEALNTRLQAEIKERKQVQEALLRSEMPANTGRMAASIAHEINNPLDAVINTLFLVRTSADLPESAREYLEIADAELMRIGYVTRQTLGFYQESSAATSNSVSALISSVVAFAAGED